MLKYIIINAVPSYPNAPVGLELIRNNSVGFLEFVALKKCEKSYLLIKNSEQDIINLLKQNQVKLDEINLEIIPVDSPYNFVFNNCSAALRAIHGEKPLPKASGEDYPVYSVEDIFCSDYKDIFVTSKNKQALNISLSSSASLAEIISQTALDGNVKAVYFGYPMGIMLNGDDLDTKMQISADYACIYTDEDCILNQLKIHVKEFLDQCCGQCVFGYEGVGQIYAILSDITNKKGKKSDLDLILELCSIMQTQSLCDIGVISANLTANCITNFRDEIEHHITKKKCKADFCNKYITYHIMPDRCKGCSQCTVLCVNEAISGKSKFVHMIDQDECVQCGMCYNSCINCAIIKAGTIKPKELTRLVPCK